MPTNEKGCGVADKAVRVWVARDKGDGCYGIWEREPKQVKDSRGDYWTGGRVVDCGLCSVWFHRLLPIKLRKGQKRQYDWLRTGTTIELREVST